MSPAYRPGYAQRKRLAPAAPRDPMAVRAWWREALALARRAAAAVEARPEASGLAESHPLWELRRQFARAPGFPIEGESARLALAGFLELLAAMAAVAIPARRPAFAKALRAAAELLDHLMHEAALDAAESWKRRLAPSERDD